MRAKIVAGIRDGVYAISEEKFSMAVCLLDCDDEHPVPHALLLIKCPRTAEKFALTKGGKNQQNDVNGYAAFYLRNALCLMWGWKFNALSVVSPSIELVGANQFRYGDGYGHGNTVIPKKYPYVHWYCVHGEITKYTLYFSNSQHLIFASVEDAQSKIVTAGEWGLLKPYDVVGLLEHIKKLRLLPTDNEVYAEETRLQTLDEKRQTAALVSTILQAFRKAVPSIAIRQIRDEEDLEAAEEEFGRIHRGENN